MSMTNPLGPGALSTINPLHDFLTIVAPFISENRRASLRCLCQAIICKLQAFIKGNRNGQATDRY